MNGLEHYLEAERLAALAEHQYGGSRDDDTHPQWTATVQLAQVHAALAATAAQFLPLFHPEHRAEWLRVLDPSSPYIPKETP